MPRLAVLMVLLPLALLAHGRSFGSLKFGSINNQYKLHDRSSTGNSGVAATENPGVAATGNSGVAATGNSGVAATEKTGVTVTGNSGSTDTLISDPDSSDSSEASSLEAGDTGEDDASDDDDGFHRIIASAIHSFGGSVNDATGPAIEASEGAEEGSEEGSEKGEEDSEKGGEEEDEEEGAEQGAEEGAEEGTEEGTEEGEEEGVDEGLESSGSKEIGLEIEINGTDIASIVNEWNATEDQPETEEGSLAEKETTTEDSSLHASENTMNNSDAVTTVTTASSLTTTDPLNRVITENNTSTLPPVTQPQKSELVSTLSPTDGDEVADNGASIDDITDGSVRPSTTGGVLDKSEGIEQTGEDSDTVPPHTNTTASLQNNTPSNSSSNVTEMPKNSTVGNGSTPIPPNVFPSITSFPENSTLSIENITVGHSVINSTQYPNSSNASKNNASKTSVADTSTTSPQTTPIANDKVIKTTDLDLPLTETTTLNKYQTHARPSTDSRSRTASPELSTTETEPVVNETLPDCFLCTAYLSDMLTWDNYSGVAILAAILIGGLFILVVIGLVAKRCYDGFTYQGYKQVDYLINGMYDPNDIDDEEYEK